MRVPRSVVKKLWPELIEEFAEGGGLARINVSGVVDEAGWLTLTPTMVQLKSGGRYNIPDALCKHVKIDLTSSGGLF